MVKLWGMRCGNDWGTTQLHRKSKPSETEYYCVSLQVLQWRVRKKKLIDQSGLERFLVNVTDRINSYIAPDPSADPIAATRLRIASNKLEKLHWDTAERKTRWHLHWLGVDPQHQRKGIGRHLAQWGLDRAIEDRVWAGIESSAVGEKLYTSMGFKVIGDRLPCIEGINMGTVMAWEPKR